MGYHIKKCLSHDKECSWRRSVGYHMEKKSELWLHLNTTFDQPVALKMRAGNHTFECNLGIIVQAIGQGM